jgi:transglutaminase-like putative cysteine protease
MLYDVSLRISYGFGREAASGRQVLRILPPTIPDRQRVIAAALDIRPRASERREGTDFFGNRMVETAHRNIQSEIEFAVTARVQLLASRPGLDLSPPLARLPEVLQRQRGIGPHSPHHFLAPSVRIAPDAAIAAFARDAVRADMTVSGAVAAINAALHRDMRFEAGATDVNTPAGEAFASRRGVCQDFSHIMITALRALGVPAGYVSGLLRTLPPEGQRRLEGADAMHAWVMAWCGEEAGWLEFDPTNGSLVANDHILVARGRDYADVAPVSGVLRTTGVQETRQSVDVTPVDPA